MLYLSTIARHGCQPVSTLHSFVDEEFVDEESVVAMPKPVEAWACKAGLSGFESHRHLNLHP
jgi:hypothetical protein